MIKEEKNIYSILNRDPGEFIRLRGIKVKSTEIVLGLMTIRNRICSDHIEATTVYISPSLFIWYIIVGNGIG